MLLEGVRDIHHRGFVHCDPNPEYILVFPSYQNGSICRLKIIDFGQVRQPRERHHMPDPGVSTFPGTAVYLSPESIIYGHINTALDIWSIGCIVLEIITEKLSWKDQNPMDLAIKIGFLRYLPKILKTMSSTGKDFLMKCLQRDPSKRWTADMPLSHPFLLP
ncbi:mitogen-activated protein kinase kinase kinase 18-like [Durio zibethinus]|uniref:Mitogen-activated protein kinase kinase kinase 18-like n=1 Tax=Durio zibethinus TaxID=66656 RepID=A0A6P6A582_DURZI|nr:mitogen-activated protein kinase kinase kinase 18-like [Durio zibethinus]